MAKRHPDPHEHHRRKHRKHHHAARTAFAAVIALLILQAVRAHDYTRVAVFGGFLIAVLALEIWMILSDKPV
ncbi:hypothetical protein JXA12_02125 [Candidatus Woesearchaeota archaeon]|nr:hypothetical protein [Candidatus Woesearchaeota archaeon]